MTADDAVADTKDAAASAVVADNSSVHILAVMALRSFRLHLHLGTADLGNMTC